VPPIGRDELGSASHNVIGLPINSSLSSAVAGPFFPEHLDNILKALGRAECRSIEQGIGERDVENLLQFEKESKSTHRIEAQGRELGLEWDILPLRNEDKIPSQDGFQLRIYCHMYPIFQWRRCGPASRQEIQAHEPIAGLLLLETSSIGLTAGRWGEPGCGPHPGGGTHLASASGSRIVADFCPLSSANARIWHRRPGVSEVCSTAFGASVVWKAWVASMTGISPLWLIASRVGG
jgi:hypothetical protein